MAWLTCPQAQLIELYFYLLDIVEMGTAVLRGVVRQETERLAPS